MTRSQYYNVLYDAFNELLKEYNPCRFNERGECARYQAGLRWPDANDTACCGGSSTSNGKPCKYLTPKGCRVKSLWCKSWLCSWVRERVPRGFYLQWRHLERLAYNEFRVHHFGRDTKQTIMRGGRCQNY